MGRARAASKLFRSATPGGAEFIHDVAALYVVRVFWLIFQIHGLLAENASSPVLAANHSDHHGCNLQAAMRYIGLETITEIKASIKNQLTS